MNAYKTLNVHKPHAGLDTYLRSDHNRNPGTDNPLRYFFAPANAESPEPTAGFPLYRDGNKAMRELTERDESTLDFIGRLQTEFGDTVQLYVGFEQEGEIKAIRPFRETEIDLKKRQERLEERLYL